MITFLQMTSSQYNQITPTNDGIYFITNTGQIYYNGILYTPTLKINNNTVKNLLLENIDFTDNNNNSATISVAQGDTQNKGIVKLQNSISENNTTAVTPSAVKDYVETIQSSISAGLTNINSLSGNVQITAGNGITVQTNNNNIVISNQHDSSSTTNSSLLIPLNGVDYESDLYSVTYNTSQYYVVIQHNFGSRCIGIIYDQNNCQQNIGIDYINDNSVKLQFTSETMPATNKIKNICLGTVGCKQQYLFVSGSKPNLFKQISHETYGIVGKLGDNESIKFKGYNANGITQLQLWLVNENDQSGNVILNIGEEKHILNVGTQLKRYIITLSERVTGIIEITRDMSSNDNEINSDITVVDWTLYSDNYKTQYLDIPYINKNVSGNIIINANNGLNQVIDGTIDNCTLYCDNILNLKQNETIKIRFQNIRNQIVVNNSYIDYNHINSFYVMFIKINGAVKQIGSIVQVQQ